ncbi:MAG: hypothetical protein RBS92_05200 [Candidatus Cloacimonadales bacterium]|jgi:hypothetical protein|nr:hypothetical protein [Candidatus Cloacimonadales bacterium]
MKNLLIILCLLAFTSLFSQHVPIDPITLDASTTLSISGEYIEKQFNSALEAIQVIANIPDVKKANWAIIKGYLLPLENKLPATFFFAQPNGDYYTLENGFTNINIAGKEYFNSCLTTRNTVSAITDYNRITGEKNLIYVVPIVVKNKVTGMIGFAIDLEKYSQEFDKLLNLPKNFIWFAVDAKGTNILNTSSEMIFQNILTDATDSMKTQFPYVFNNNQGAILFEYENIQREALFHKIESLNWWLILARADEDQLMVMPLLNVSLENITRELKAIIDNANNDLADKINSFQPNVKNPDAIRSMLNEIIKDNPLYYAAVFTNKKGVMQIVEPVEFRNFEKKPIPCLDYLRTMEKDVSPYFTNIFKAMNDHTTFMIVHPYQPKRKFEGAFHILMRPDLLLNSVTKKMNFSESEKLWIIQLDGTIVYSQDEDAIGKDLTKEVAYSTKHLPIYTSILSLDDSGEPIHYKQADTEMIFEWQTIQTHNKIWRIVLTKNK